ncbi:hypothetical protein GCM10027048_42600 [Hymenobacter coalescens]
MADNAVLRRAAAAVSLLGHPLVTAVLFTGFAAFRLLDARTAAWALALVTLGVAGPMAAWSWWQVRRGRYTNFDVSVREQRRSFYPRLLGLLGAGAALAFSIDSAAAFRPGLVVALGLLALCYVLNFWLKVSLHAALSFFLAAGVGLLAGAGWGSAALALAALVAASRLVLRRHTVPEVLAGAALGLGAAAVLMSLH